MNVINHSVKSVVVISKLQVIRHQVKYGSGRSAIMIKTAVWLFRLYEWFIYYKFHEISHLSAMVVKAATTSALQDK